jgi:hypothetical protein
MYRYDYRIKPQIYYYFLESKLIIKPFWRMLVLGT